MPINRQKYPRLILLSLLTAVSIPVMVAGTENQASATTQAGAVTEEPAPTTQEAEEVGTDPQQAEEKTPPVSGAAVKPVKPFKPTEKIEADSAVSFPIDI